MIKALKPVAIDFHGHNLEYVEHNNEPFVVMRRIVEGMGVDWKTQHRKLMSNERRWSVVTLPTETAVGTRDALCMPVRKLPAFLCSIDHRRVSDAIRPIVELFQEECDTALWLYWNQGAAPRLSSPPPEPETVVITKTRYIELLESENARLRGPERRPRKITTPELRAAIVELRRSGASLMQIEKRTGANRGTIVTVCKEAGIPSVHV